ncbi:hypothetical protein BC832DRAFT_562267 [Gaertneriomyces semiglobifer]|nr:hypothetical protein BC832DRAFT_562267 [Gaertneriomyces semiglobifer]
MAGKNTVARTLVVALDQSPTSAHALTYALENVIRPGDTLVLVSVGVAQAPEWADVVEATVEHEIPDVQEIERQASAVINQAEKLVFEKFPTGQIKIVRRPLTGTDAHTVIVDTCDKTQASMLIIGSRNLPGFKRLILGSVSDECAHKANCPVLIVKDEKTDEEGGRLWPLWLPKPKI